MWGISHHMSFSEVFLAPMKVDRLDSGWLDTNREVHQGYQRVNRISFSIWSCRGYMMTIGKLTHPHREMPGYSQHLPQIIRILSRYYQIFIICFFLSIMFQYTLKLLDIYHFRCLNVNDQGSQALYPDSIENINI